MSKVFSHDLAKLELKFIHSFLVKEISRDNNNDLISVINLMLNQIFSGNMYKAKFIK
jgi:hypothetical protein